MSSPGLRNILITGANGFLGSNLLGYLHEKTDCTIWNAGRSGSANSIENLVRNHNLRDVTVILNGWGGVHTSHKRDLELQSRSLQDFKSQVDECLENRVNTILGFGTQAEFSELPREPGDEFRGYSSAKVEARKYLLAATVSNQIRSKWIRIFSVYGSGMDDRWLIPKVLRAVNSRTSLDLGPCSQLWGLLHIRDFCAAIATLLESSHEGFDLDLGAPADQSLKDLIRHVEKLFGEHGLINFNPGEHPPNSIPNLDVLRSLGWSPEVDFGEGILEMVRNEKK